MGLNNFIQIGTTIKNFRIAKGFSQKEMAMKLGLERSTYSNYENNLREPKAEIIKEIADVLGIEVEVLLQYKQMQKQESNNISKLVGKKVAIVNLSDFDGNKPNHYDYKYIEKALNRVVTIVHKFKDNDLYLTDFFIEEFMEENNDYIHYGFLKVLRGNFKTLES